MTAALEALGVGKRHRRRWALRDCTFSVPEQTIVGLTGPNSSGKSTLLGLAVGLLQPTEGTLRVFGDRPADAVQHIGYVAQDAPLYKSFTVGEMLEYARALNSARWDNELALELLDSRVLTTRVSALTPGERARLALALALGKRPKLLLLDEPLASLDRLAGREFLQVLMDGVAQTGASVVVATRVVTDIERVCERIVLLCDGAVRLEGSVEDLLARHRLLTGARRPLGRIRGVDDIVRARHSGRQLTLLVRTDGPIVDPTWSVDEIGLEDMLLAYMTPEELLTPEPPQTRGSLGGRLRWHG
jgi:ABC-2 type transport system ATP-binding protein